MIKAHTVSHHLAKIAGHRRISKIPLAHLIQPLLYFAKKNSVWCLCSLFNTESFSLCTYGGTTFWIKIVCLTICLEEVDGTSSLLATISECIFSSEKCSSTTALILLQHGVSINFFSWTYFFSFLFFFQTFFYPSTWFLSLLTLESSYNYLVSEFLAFSCSFLDAVNAGYGE